MKFKILPRFSFSLRSLESIVSQRKSSRRVTDRLSLFYIYIWEVFVSHSILREQYYVGKILFSLYKKKILWVLILRRLYILLVPTDYIKMPTAFTFSVVEKIIIFIGHIKC